MKSCIAYVDGGSRGNPGIAGYGVVFQDERGHQVACISQKLGIRTNNFAEYSALVGALEYALANGYKTLQIFADSELLVRQINGTYRVKSPDLKPLYEKARALITRLSSFSIRHVPRSQNREADRLANLAMDGTAIETPHPREAQPRRRVAAVFRGGCFYPSESIDLPENTPCQLTINPVVPDASLKELEAPEGTQ